MAFFATGHQEEALDIVPPVFSERFEIVAEITLMMVGFLIGGKLTMSSLKNGVNVISLMMF